jgi:hypothetical protein
MHLFVLLVYSVGSTNFAMVKMTTVDFIAIELPKYILFVMLAL